MSDNPRPGTVGLHPGVDSETLESLRLARSGRPLLEMRLRPTELWEIVQLRRSEGPSVATDLERLERSGDPDGSAPAAQSLFTKLQDIRRQDGPWVDRLRGLLLYLPGLPQGETREFLIALVTISPQAREAASRWFDDPEGSRPEANEVLLRLVRIAQVYQRALENGAAKMTRTADPGPSPAPPPPPRKIDTSQMDPRSGITRILPRGVNLEMLEDVGRVDHCRKILMGFDPEVELWECFCLVMKDDVAWRDSIDQLIRRETTGPAEDFAQGAHALFNELQQIRAEHGSFVRQLAAFLGDLPVGQYATETRELALGFIVGSPAGRERAALWLGDPVHYRQEAATRFEGIIGRAMNYQTALRSI